ncbi:nonstructural protein [Microviridae sp.]|nr:nonstructural protein [Microviridae sp.]
MNKLLTLTIFDSKVGEHLQLLTAKSVGEASRMFESACQDPNSNFNKYPADFTLVHNGYYYPESGSLESLEKNIIISSASEYTQNNDN